MANVVQHAHSILKWRRLHDNSINKSRYLNQKYLLFKNKKQIFDVEREVPPNPPPICNFQKSEKRLSREIKQTRVLFLFQSSKREIELKKTLCLDTRCRNASHAIIVVGVCLTHTRTHTCTRTTGAFICITFRQICFSRFKDWHILVVSCWESDSS